MLSGAAAGPALGGFAAGLMGLNGPFWVAGGDRARHLALYAFFAFRRSDETGAPGRIRHGLRGASALLLMLPFLCVLLVNLAIFLTRTAAQWQMIPLMAADRFRHGGGCDRTGPDAVRAERILAVLPLAGILVDTVPRGRIIVVSLLAAAAALVLIVWADSTVAFYLGMIGMGAATGLGGPAVAAHAVDVRARGSHRRGHGNVTFRRRLRIPDRAAFRSACWSTWHWSAMAAQFSSTAALARRRQPDLRPVCRRAPCARASPPRYDLTEERTMTERIWDKFLTERDKAVFAASG